MARTINVGTGVVLVVSTPLLSAAANLAAANLPTPADTPIAQATPTGEELATASMSKIDISGLPMAVPSIQSTGVINDTVALHLAPLITDIDFTALQKRDKIIVLEHMAELYNAYFPAPNAEEEWGNFVDALFEAFIWTATAVSSGILGNLAYDILRDALKRRSEIANAQRKNYWEAIHRDYEQVLKVALESVQQNKGVRVREIMERTSIDDKEKVKCWLKLMGAKHTHAGPEACAFQLALASSPPKE